MDASGRSDAGGRTTPGDRFRSVAQLDMLHSLAARLNALGDVEGIGAAITAELGSIIDYHNCRVYLLERDGRTLRPIAFRGELSSEYEEETFEELVTVVGEGITGWVAEQRESLLTPDAREVEFAVTIPGTDDDLLESMLAVPMLAGDDVVGVIVLSSLGYGRFDEEDRRLLEVLASHAAVAIVNARLFQAEREAAETSSALLRMSQALTGLRSVAAVVEEAVDTVPSVVACSAAAAYVHDDRAGRFRLVRLLSLDGTVARAPDDVADVPDAAAAALGFTASEPQRLEAGALPDDLSPVSAPRQAIVAPLRWGSTGAGALLLVAADPASPFDERDVRVARGVADLASLALGNAERITELQRFHELAESVDAVFWEADVADLRFTFVGGRCEELLGADAARWAAEGRSWGSHVRDDDRERAVAAVRSAVEAAEDTSVEYPVEASDGGTRWIRDLVHVVRGDRGPTELRGLMVDITERRLAEEALARSERRHSDAFLREREATQRLRALDEMKNTFLEAVSHDLRTPLTSILGSALTLEQTRLDLPRDDALDLVRRIATNARKLERLLGDLLDLDRLQRGIVGPQRRAVDLATLIATGIAETENPIGRRIEVDVEPATVSVDAAKVERILENLLSNALRHTPRGAMIWVRAWAEDGACTIVVEDDGPGVPDGFKEAVFEPFRQAPGSSSGHAPGVGIGLSLVRRFAELHGGRAWVTDREGGGASFHVWLPGAPRRQPADAGHG